MKRNIVNYRIFQNIVRKLQNIQNNEVKYCKLQDISEYCKEITEYIE